MIYLIWGRDFLKNRDPYGKIGMDLAFGAGVGGSLLVDSKLFYNFELGSIGFYTQYRYYFITLDTCFENCDYTSYLKSRWSFGLILIGSPGK
jgi:hypothetical protein